MAQRTLASRIRWWWPLAPPGHDIGRGHTAGLLRGGRTELVKALGSELRVPASADIVLEGHIYPDASHPGGYQHALEGPYGDHTGAATLTRCGVGLRQAGAVQRKSLCSKGGFGSSSPGNHPATGMVRVSTWIDGRPSLPYCS
jgi:hypothetical protein